MRPLTEAEYDELMAFQLRHLRDSKWKQDREEELLARWWIQALGQLVSDGMAARLREVMQSMEAE